MKTIIKNNPISRKEKIVVQELENEVLIYDLKINKAYCLNETSRFVWQLCDGNNSVSGMSRSLSRKLKTDVGEDLIWLSLDQLKQNNLLEKSDEVEIDFGGLNRRQIIRKIGFASLVTLPVIASVVAPNAVSAQSLSPFLASCTADSQCASGNCSDSNPVFPQLCCVPGNSIARPPGTPRACAPSQAICNLMPDVLNSCCSGTATLSNIACPGGFNCVCD